MRYQEALTLTTAPTAYRAARPRRILCDETLGRARSTPQPARPAGQPQDDGGDRRTCPGQQCGRDPDHEMGLLQALRQVRADALANGQQAEDDRGQQEPSEGTHQRRAQAPDRSDAARQRVDQIGCRDHVPQPPVPRMFRKLLIPRWVATFSDATVIPLIAAASFNDFSSIFNNRMAWRCPAGSLSIAAARSRRSNAFSERFS